MIKKMRIGEDFAAFGISIYLSIADFGRRLDPFELIAQLLNGIDQRSDIARHIVEKMDLGHLFLGKFELFWTGMAMEIIWGI